MRNELTHFRTVTRPTERPNVSSVDETPLPGIGKRLEFFTSEGRRMGVVQHHDGRRELFVCTAGDPDRASVSVDLSEDDTGRLSDALGVAGSEASEDRTYEVEGLVFAWIDIAEDSPVAGHSIAQQRVRTRTGASIVAAIGPDLSVPAPEPTFVIESGQTLVVAGTADGVSAVRDLVAGG